VIIDLQLKRLEKQLADRKLKLEVTSAAKDVVMNDGYDPNFGARPMRRSIQKLIQDPLALRLLGGDSWRATRLWWIGIATGPN